MSRRPVLATLALLLAFAVPMLPSAQAPAAEKSPPPPAPAKDRATPPAPAPSKETPPAPSKETPPAPSKETPPPPADSKDKPAPPAPAPQPGPVYKPPPAPPPGPVYKSPPADPPPSVAPVFTPQLGGLPSLDDGTIDALPPGGGIAVPPPSLDRPTPEPRPTTRPAPAGDALEGRFRSETNGDVVTIRRLREGCYLLEGPDWDGVGLFDGRTYRGVFRFDASTRETLFAGASGWHFIEPDGDALYVQSELENEERDRFSDTWTRVGSRDTGDAGARPKYPEFGEYAHVDELPEAIRKVAPEYPDQARRNRIDGTVMIQALVLEDGTVGDTRVVKSIPLLDEAAAACVRRWVFKPALTHGKPVAVWVAVPIKFSLR